MHQQKSSEEMMCILIKQMHCNYGSLMLNEVCHVEGLNFIQPS